MCSMSMAYHVHTDGHTEHINQVVESYLRSYRNYAQNTWDVMLAMAEAAYNNSKQTANKPSPCYAHYGFELQNISQRRSSFETHGLNSVGSIW